MNDKSFRYAHFSQLKRRQFEVFQERYDGLQFDIVSEPYFASKFYDIDRVNNQCGEQYGS